MNEGIAIGIVLAVGTLFALYFTDVSIQVGTDVGDRAPSFTLTDIDGKNFSLKDYRGKIVVIDFMAGWCSYCKLEMSHLKEIYSSYSDEEAVILWIDVDPNESVKTIRSLKEGYGGDWTYARGPEVAATYGVTAIPTLYMLDSEGKIVYKNVGVTSVSALLSKIDEHR